MKNFYEKLKLQAQQNPVLAVAVAVTAVTAVTKLMEANTQRTYAKTHEREINRRVAMQSFK